MSGTATPVVIVIPTYNRAAALGRMLRDLCDAGFASLPLVISDDSTDDGTRKLLADGTTWPGLEVHHLHHSSRLGMDGSQLAALRYCRERFGDVWIWFLSDDDLLYPAIARSVVEFLSGCRAKACFINWDVLDATGGLSTLAGSVSSGFDVDMLLASGYIGAVALRAGAVDVTPEVEALDGTSYIHIGLLCSAAAAPSDIAVFSRPAGCFLPNFGWRFSFGRTFLRGYPQALDLCRFIEPAELEKRSLRAIRTWLSVLILGRLGLLEAEYRPGFDEFRYWIGRYGVVAAVPLILRAWAARLPRPALRLLTGPSRLERFAEGSRRARALAQELQRLHREAPFSDGLPVPLAGRGRLVRA